MPISQIWKIFPSCKPKGNIAAYTHLYNSVIFLYFIFIIFFYILHALHFFLVLRLLGTCSFFVCRSTSRLLVVHVKPSNFCVHYRSKPQPRLKEILQRQSQYRLKSTQALWREQIPLTTTNTSFYGPLLKAGQGLQKTMCAVPSRPQFQGMVLYGQACFTQWASIFWM